MCTCPHMIIQTQSPPSVPSWFFPHSRGPSPPMTSADANPITCPVSDLPDTTPVAAAPGPEQPEQEEEPAPHYELTQTDHLNKKLLASVASSSVIDRFRIAPLSDDGESSDSEAE
ncbi:hypothetical protein H696_03141 [Fonticula alba]|uniref:Uncharacterized protein n=1 Tax=Fonticula alba TaxID=691883 RepID=A0A058Z941_FONAL|nr:hypothetical protein H696_03141 [Fonticula alba]KCV70790.1 hypothetical protein H696_03141 [Fonticula alba]|eukprot:XP_009495306.1 hypothetical protein H696_03141 [Fonticula alba]